MAGIPASDIAIDAGLVHALLVEQCGWLAGEPLELFANGWDNVSFRVGEALLARLPRRAIAAPLIEHEQAWLPLLAELVPVPVPVPVLAGKPSARYPYPWSVVPLFPGRMLAEASLAERRVIAPSLARVFEGLHVPADRNAPANPFRGVPLSQRAEAIEQRLLTTPGFGADAATAFRTWSSAPEYRGAALWLHGDPHPLNLLTKAGALSGVIDWGDLTAGDPASDLATAWLTFDAAGREVFIDHCTADGRYDEAVWQRARAWALALASAFVAHGDDMPLLAQAGRHAAAELLGR